MKYLSISACLSRSVVYIYNVVNEPIGANLSKEAFPGIHTHALTKCPKYHRRMNDIDP